MLISSTTGLIALRHRSDALALQALARVGFQACDFSMWNYPWHGGMFDSSDEVFDSYFTELNAVSKAYKIGVGQIHAPFPTSCGDAAEDAHRINIIKRSIRATALLGCNYIVIHPALHSGCLNDIGHAEAMEINLALYSALIPSLAEYGVKAAIENMFSGDPDTGRICPTFLSTAEEMVTLLESLGSEHFCACMDIGHASLVGEDPAKMISTLGNWLRVLHVHDNDGVSDQHILPFLGKTNFNMVCEALSRTAYPGNINLEADNTLSAFPIEMEDIVLRLMAETAQNLAKCLDKERC